MRLWKLVGLCCLILFGCAAPTEVKKASSQVMVGLNELRKAQAAFRDTFIRELEATQDLVGRAILANAVVNKVNALSTAEQKGNLIEISRQINDEREAYGELVRLVLAQKIKPDENEPDPVVKRVLQARAKDLRKAATELEATLGPNAHEVKDLNRRAEALESNPKGAEPQYDHFVMLIRLELTKRDVRRGAEELDKYIQLVQNVHAQLNEWIATDVTVNGEQVAGLIEKHQGILGLGN